MSIYIYNLFVKRKGLSFEGSNEHTYNKHLNYYFFLVLLLYYYRHCFICLPLIQPSIISLLLIILELSAVSHAALCSRQQRRENLEIKERHENSLHLRITFE